MQPSQLTLEEVKLLLSALDDLANKVKASDQPPEAVQKALEKIAALKMKLEDGSLCEAGAEQICASTRIGVFW